MSPCKVAGVAFAIVELDQYVSDARLERAKLVATKALALVTRGQLTWAGNEKTNG